MTLENDGSGNDTGEPAGTGSGGAGGGTAGAGNTGQDGSLLGQGQGQPTGQETGQEVNQGQPKNQILDFISDEDLKNDPSIQQFNNVEDMAKSFVHAQKLVGKDKIPLPSSSDDSEAWNDVLAKLGRPDQYDQYALPQPADDSPVQVAEEMQTAFQQKAHELGLTNKQASDLWGWYISDIAENEISKQQSRAEEARAEAETQLRKEFGNAFQDKLADAQRAAKEYGGDELIQKLDQTGLGNDPDVLKFLAQVGSGLREDTVGGSSQPMGRTPDQARQEIGELKADKQFMQVYMDNTAAGHDAAVQKMNRLYRDAYPEQ